MGVPLGAIFKTTGLGKRLTFAPVATSVSNIPPVKARAGGRAADKAEEVEAAGIEDVAKDTPVEIAV